MIDKALSYIAPHHCCGCGQTGTLLCDNCKYDIISEPFWLCVSCGHTASLINGLCSKCKTVPYSRAWCVSDRRDHMQRLIDDFKFSNTKAAFHSLADLLDSHLPELPRNVVIVPVPTISSHIRQRGYDHTLLIARRLAQLRHLKVDTSLQRITKTKQRLASAKQRAEQAKVAFGCSKQLDDSKVYLLIDDVITTGSTVKYASKTLLDAGASEVWVASLSRQTLD